MEAILSGGYILLAIFGFAFVIFIHELGHFAFAKWAGYGSMFSPSALVR